MPAPGDVMYAYMPPPAAPKTPDGLKWSTFAFTVFMGAVVVSLALAVYTATLMSDATQFLSSVLTFLALGALIGILTLIALILFFIGFGYAYGGRSEMGPAHARNVSLSLYTLIAALVIAPVGYVIRLVLIFGAMFPGQGNVAAAQDALRNSTIVGIAFDMITAALAALTILLIVRALARPDHQTLLYAATGLGVATPGIVGALTLWQFARFLMLGGTATTSDPTVGIPAALGAGLELLTFGLFLLAYRGAMDRIRRGELRPTVPQPAIPWLPVPVVPMVPYPVPPPPSPPPAPPSAPPEGPAP